MKKYRNKTLLGFTIIYHLVALISLFGLYPKDIFYNEFADIGIYVTIPISFISWGLRFSSTKVDLLVIGIQLFFFILNLYINKRIERKQRY
ncbi:hypothetical protein MG290_12850 [Flavobacterium sp. CBA20B-1]|uniref:hypothetical protein n=1 Tax=unclassified Flavobacterium TaxID=196869 RepID=UPI00222476C5|nr:MULTISPECIES: hypothetical protein [unclassified Flavobacterium]WCM41815.1 hypothetical protein MG290_12850 [Flavobacterium sp. CBA20B-1]